MESKDIRAELSIKMLELEKALDVGLPYPDLKIIYSEVKELQYQFALSELGKPIITGESESTDAVLE